MKGAARKRTPLILQLVGTILVVTGVLIGLALHILGGPIVTDVYTAQTSYIESTVLRITIIIGIAFFGLGLIKTQADR